MEVTSFLSLHCLLFSPVLTDVKVNEYVSFKLKKNDLSTETYPISLHLETDFPTMWPVRLQTTTPSPLENLSSIFLSWSSSGFLLRPLGYKGRSLNRFNPSATVHNKKQEILVNPTCTPSSQWHDSNFHSAFRRNATNQQLTAQPLVGETWV